MANEYITIMKETISNMSNEELIDRFASTECRIATTTGICNELELLFQTYRAELLNRLNSNK